jgi:hypothetical protein
VNHFRLQDLEQDLLQLEERTAGLPLVENLQRALIHLYDGKGTSRLVEDLQKALVLEQISEPRLRAGKWHLSPAFEGSTSSRLCQL